VLQLLIRIVSSASAMVTAGAVLATASNVPGTAKVGLWSVILVAGYAIVADLISYMRSRPLRLPPMSPRIAEFMCKWLTSGGQAAVFSHDLSWVSPGSRISGILETKARAGELVLFVGRTPDIVRQLAMLGATIFDYSRLGFMPRSRFTIVDKDKAGARMAIGLVEGNKHVIREYGVADHAILALGEDLVRLAERLSEQVR
jgi:hypothetical protein